MVRVANAFLNTKYQEQKFGLKFIWISGHLQNLRFCPFVEKESVISGGENSNV